MDEFKRTYSNKDVSESLPYLWQNFDKENYSFWLCEYLYPEDLRQIFMTSNLVGGMLLVDYLILKKKAAMIQNLGHLWIK